MGKKRKKNKRLRAGRKKAAALMTFVRRSCITGKIVWVCHTTSKGAARLAYWRACRKELERMRQWTKTVSDRCSNIMRFLSDCTAEIPITSSLTTEQTAAARKLKALGPRKEEYHTDFYDHIVEERRRREGNTKNDSYDK